jgi:hypothetical protein
VFGIARTTAASGYEGQHAPVHPFDRRRDVAELLGLVAQDDDVRARREARVPVDGLSTDLRREGLRPRGIRVADEDRLTESACEREPKVSGADDPDLHGGASMPERGDRSR